MGKITKALQGVPLNAKQQAEIKALDKHYSDLQQYFDDHQTVENEHGSLKNPKSARKPREPYNPEQGTGTAPPQVISGRRKPITGR